ncbi:MAG: class I SAM-dependent methyltransferase [Chloroflexota bacterium]
MSADTDRKGEGLAWQIRVWDRMAPIYIREVDPRFAPVIDQLLARAQLQPGQRILDLGTGTGAVAVRAAAAVGPGGRVVAVDLSVEMLELARERAVQVGCPDITFEEGRAETIPAGDQAFDAVLASLSMMYVIDRAAAAREIARVLRPGGRLVAAVWAGSAENDLVRLQETAGCFAPAPPVPGVGPGALADPTLFNAQLAEAGIAAHVEQETLGFDFGDFTAAWDVMVGVTAAHLDPERQQEAKQAVFTAMWPTGDGPRHFRNVTQFFVGERQR